MAPQVSSPGDVLRRSAKTSSQVFEEIKLFLRGQPSVPLCETQSLIEALVMIDFVVLHISVRILKEDDATVLVFRDMLGQDRIRFHKFVGRLQGALAGEDGDSDSDFDWESPESPESESPESIAGLMKEATSPSKKAAEAAQILALWARDRPASRAAIARAGAKVQMSQLPQESALPLLAAMQCADEPICLLSSYARSHLGYKLSEDDSTKCTSPSPSSNRRSCSVATSSDSVP
ncbi:unnamed protein product [Effrenium voratum]|uniref:Uncharacterized protein n=1 Tax=Effrenium voratum TaxID=2562239 RepID=A0AA36MV97_9DINO|nr:unnamed protein product [Effrenium voratum]CAJ1416614.1 unnamed protein product [Effrenium voratum]